MLDLPLTLNIKNRYVQTSYINMNLAKFFCKNRVFTNFTTRRGKPVRPNFLQKPLEMVENKWCYNSHVSAYRILTIQKTIHKKSQFFFWYFEQTFWSLLVCALWWWSLSFTCFCWKNYYMAFIASKITCLCMTLIDIITHAIDRIRTQVT